MPTTFTMEDLRQKLQERQHKMTPQRQTVLQIFLDHRGKLLSREFLLDEIVECCGDYVNDNTLSVYIRRLRSKIEKDPVHPVILQTVRGLGYRLL